MEKRVVELERELKETNERLAATREQLRLQSRRARQLVAACTSKVEDKEREMRMLRALKDGQLQSIVRKLLHFESLLRQEQRRVVDLVQQKDRIIRNQQLELDELRRQTSSIGSDADSSEFVSSSGSSSLSSSPAGDHSTASKLAKLDHHEDKENSNVNASDSVPETPLVTKMVRRFELNPAAPCITRKPEVPKKPTRLLPTTNTVTSSTAAIINNINNMDSLGQQQQQNQSAVISKGVVRTDSVNDHGYFTLEKRKPVKMSVVSPEPNEQQQQRHSPCSPRDQRTVDHVTDETDLRNNFEEFHLMDSLEEEEQQQLLQQQQQQGNESTATTTTTMNETPSLATPPPPRTPDRSSGDGAEWIMHTPPHAPSSADCTALSVSAGSVHLLPQIGDATPTSSSGVQFDRFLDVSGLTQKSILTPSRLLSNHKNMLKPKDVKHRHMVNKASHHHLLLQHQQQQMQQSSSMVNCRSSSQSLLLDPAHLHHRNHSTSQVRYYVEPFL